VNAHRDTMARDRVFISAVGDITADELGALIDDLLADLPATGAAMPERVEVALEPGVTVVEYDTPQSVALFGHRGIERDNPDFFAAFIASTILGGGGFESRLMDEVRDKRGLTYGVYAFLSPRDHAEMVQGQVASANDRIAAAIEVIKDEWARLANEGVTQEELDATKTYLTGAYPLRFDGNAPIARILMGMQMGDLPIDYINTRNAKVNEVTLEHINRVIREVYLPDELHFTVVGKPDGL
ncbi:M16 family metallopeptidase, partial [Planktotalea sp.]|uniref:M16 family metallopeptidase n=1 Tax=Planktotalea sp. TaxID=2029877 RepID=UPI0035C7AA9B